MQLVMKLIEAVARVLKSKLKEKIKCTTKLQKVLVNNRANSRRKDDSNL